MRYKFRDEDEEGEDNEEPEGEDEEPWDEGGEEELDVDEEY